jgi:hypothetical protein
MAERPDKLQDFVREGIPYLPVRSWDNDYERLLNSERFTESSQKAVQNPVQTSPGTISSAPLPEFGTGQVAIPHGLRGTGQNGRTWGIDVNTRIRGGRQAVTDNALLEELKTACRELGFIVEVYDALRLSRGSGSARSRHFRADALDIARIDSGGGYRSCSLDHPDRPNNQDAIRLCEWFIAHGYKPGVESGARRALLFGNHSFSWNKTGIPHHHHIHISTA